VGRTPRKPRWEKRHGHLRTGGQDEGDAIAAPEPQRAKRRPAVIDMRGQTRVRTIYPAWGGYGAGVRRTRR